MVWTYPILANNDTGTAKDTIESKRINFNKCNLSQDLTSQTRWRNKIHVTYSGQWLDYDNDDDKDDDDEKVHRSEPNNAWNGAKQCNIYQVGLAQKMKWTEWNCYPTSPKEKIVYKGIAQIRYIKR